MKVVCIASFKCTDNCVTGEQGQLYQLYHVHVISAGLRQRTAARHVGLQHQQAAGGAKLVGQDSLSSPSVSQCQFDSAFPTRSLSSPTRHVPPANRLTSLTSCKTTDQPEHYDHRTNCYCLYSGVTSHCGPPGKNS